MEIDYEIFITQKARNAGSRKGRLYRNPKNYEKVHKVLLNTDGWLAPSEIAFLCDGKGVGNVRIGRSKPLTPYQVGLLMKKLIKEGLVEKSSDSHATYRAVKR